MLGILEKAIAAELGHVDPDRRMEGMARALRYLSTEDMLDDIGREPLRTVSGPALVAFLDRPNEACTPLAAHRVMARYAIQVVMARDPLAHRRGYGRRSGKAGLAPRAERKRIEDQEFQRNRQALLKDDKVVDEFLRAHAFCSVLEKTKRPRPTANSYRLKHDAEWIAYRLPDGIELAPGFVSNGAIVLAAIYAGFDVAQTAYSGPNVRINASVRSIMEVLREVE